MSKINLKYIANQKSTKIDNQVKKPSDIIKNCYVRLKKWSKQEMENALNGNSIASSKNGMTKMIYIAMFEKSNSSIDINTIFRP